MTVTNRLHPLIACLLGGLLLVGCSSTSDSAKPDAKAEKKDAAAAPAPKIPPCPQVAAIRDLSHFPAATAEAETRISSDDILYHADIGQIAGSCDADEKEGLTVNADIEFKFSSGPALRHTPNVRNSVAKIPYFVAVIGPGSQILTKQQFTLEADLGKALADDGSSQHEPVKIVIPLKAAAQQVLIGFQLSPEQVSFNRAPPMQPYGGVMAPVQQGASPIAPIPPGTQPQQH